MTNVSTTHNQKVSGSKIIGKYLKNLPENPGVYRMLDRGGEVLYVGKAVNLRKRVTNYSKFSGHSLRTIKMIELTCSMMFLTTRTETEALLLEQNLIKQLKPKYNVLLRDDKSFPNILVSKTHAFSQIKKHRGKRSEKGNYYGPFASAGAVNRTLNQLQKIFMLRNCTDAQFNNRSRPCLLFQIKKCSGPCVGKITENKYSAAVKDAEDFLKGRNSSIQEKLALQMHQASKKLDFENAAIIRDKIHALTQIQQHQGINPKGVPEADIIAIHQEGNSACVQVFFIRGHQNWGNKAYFPQTGNGAEIQEILEAFIVQFYGNKTPPKIILLSSKLENTELVEHLLSKKSSYKVKISYPQVGEKAILVENARRNAEEALARKNSEHANQTKLLKNLATALKIKTPLNRVEVYDNSHIQGTNAIGGMIVSGPDGFIKNAYRKFNISPSVAQTGDDLAMMKEVIYRRFSKLSSIDPTRSKEAWPDLMIIDGGAGQVSAVEEILSDLGLNDLNFIGIAKGEERNAGKELFYKLKEKPFSLRHTDPTLYFVQRLRDEAHRFAIGAHRAKRKKSNFRSPLDEIKGVGQFRKRSLLSHFGSVKAISRADLKDLQSVEGISNKLAKNLHDFFHEAK